MTSSINLEEMSLRELRQLNRAICAELARRFDIKWYPPRTVEEHEKMLRHPMFAEWQYD